MNLFSQTAVPPKGEGTEDNPYQIGSLENLYWTSINLPENIPLYGMEKITMINRWEAEYVCTES